MCVVAQLHLSAGQTGVPCRPIRHNDAHLLLQGTLNEVKAEQAERDRLGAAPNYQRTLP
jgi:hypothetical protein